MRKKTMQLPESPLKKKPTGGGKPSFPHWRFSVGYFVLMLFVLYAWQSMLQSVTVQTINYSECKDRLARGEVVRADVRDRDIEGWIRPKTPATTGEVPAGETPTWQFRTIRIDDQYLAAELQQAKVEFKGVVPNILQEFVF